MDYRYEDMSDPTHDSYHWGDSASPAGSGAGLASDVSITGNQEIMDEYDAEVELEDEEELAAFLAAHGLDGGNCYLASNAHTFAATSPTVGTGPGNIQHFTVYGYSCTSHKPPIFDGTDLNNWINAAKYWMDHSTLLEKNEVPTIVNNLAGLATRWIEELNQDRMLLQSPSGLDDDPVRPTMLRELP